MHIEVKNMQYEATPANTAVFIGKTLLNGIYTDLGDDYVFIPEGSVEGYDEVTSLLVQEQVAVYELESYDPNAQPFCFMINGLCRVFRCELDDLQV